MKSTFAAAAILLFAGNALAQFTINTPGPAVVCQPLLITWTGGTPPYFLTLLPGNQPTAAPLLDFGQQTGTQFSWPAVNFTAGTNLGLNLRDSTGAIAQSGVIPVQAGSDTSCLTASGSSTTSAGSSTTGTTAPTAPATTPTAPATTPTAPTSGSITTTPSGTTSRATSTTGTTTAATTSKTSAANANMANAGLAGAFGIGAALMALVL